MIADLKPYPDYKESGLPWLGQVPNHWEIKRAKSIFRRVDKRSTTGKEELLTVSSARGIVPRKTANVTMFKAESYLGYKLCWPGDLVINSLWAWAGGLGVSNHHGIISSAYGVYRVRPDVKLTPTFVHEFVRSASFHWELRVRSKGVWTSRLQLTDISFLEAPIQIPPPAEQGAIVRFLDWANGRLERAIRAKRKVIALLNEQKQAVIHRAVTCGLDPSVPLRPSGIPWLGDIPQHWEVMPVKRICSLVRDGTHLPPARTLTGFPLLSVRNMVGGRLVRRPDDSFISKADFEKLNSSFVIHPNDVLMAIVGATLGKVAVVDDIGPFQIQRSVSILRPRPKLMSHNFLATFLRSPRLQQHLWQSVAFSAQPGIYLGFVANIPVPVPPTIAEQVSIHDGLQRELSPIGSAISRLEREIELLREYRTRLVADLVTGKLDVREAATRLPQEAAHDVGPDDTESIEETEPAEQEGV